MEELPVSFDDEMDISLEEFNKVWNAIHQGLWSPINNPRMQNLIQDFLDSDITVVWNEAEALKLNLKENQKMAQVESKEKAADEARKKAVEEARQKAEAEAQKKANMESKEKAKRRITLDFEVDENQSEDSFDRMCDDQRSLQEKVMTISSNKFKK